MTKPEDMTPEELTAFVGKCLADAKARPTDPAMAKWWKAVTSTKGLDRIVLK